MSQLQKAKAALFSYLQNLDWAGGMKVKGVYLEGGESKQDQSMLDIHLTMFCLIKVMYTSNLF